MKKGIIILLTLLLIYSGVLMSQSLSVNMMNLNEYYHRQQLLGKIDSTLSLSIRPLYTEALSIHNIYDPGDRLDFIRKTSFDGVLKFHKGRGRLQLLPISLLNQFNSHHPEGYNDGSMIPAKGTQLRVSGGFYFKYGPLKIKFKPEFVYAQNKHFQGFPANYADKFGVRFPNNPYRNFIDLPEKFGDGSYKNEFWGQSSICLTIGGISFGISNENLWWGPGYKNSLLMTNSAPGFMHLTFNTVRPIKTFIGSFEGQIISGKLKDSGFSVNLNPDWRYLNAMILSFQPKWIPGLFFGATRSFQVYHEDMGTSFGDYIPIFIPLSKSASNNGIPSDTRNQLFSVFMRWVFTEANGEIYLEYGKEDHSWDTRDIVIEFFHSSSFIVGFRKLFIIDKQNATHLQFIAEISNLSANQSTINRSTENIITSWYTHYEIKHGYTNRGQLLGAGIGPGSNLQTIHLSWNKGLKQIGIELERFVHNNDFWYNYIKDFRTNWIDLSATLNANWDYNHFILFGKMKFISSINYQWLYEPKEIIPGEYWMPTDDTFNFHFQVGITYRF